MKRFEVGNTARFLTFSCYRRLPLFKNDAIKAVFVEQLSIARERHSATVHAWVLMPEHVHLIIRCPGEATVTDFLRSLKTSIAKRVIARWRDLDAGVLSRIETPNGQHRFWQHGGGYDRNLVMGDELRNKIDYIHHNPVRRGLVEKPTDWEWSSARWWAGDRDGPIECDQIW